MKKILFAIMALVAIAVLATFLWPAGRKSVVTNSDSAGRSELMVAAAKEADVNIWATNAEDVRWIPSAFNKRYPNIKVEIYTDLNVAMRVITEARAGRHSVDVVWNSEALVQPLIQRNLLIGDDWKDLGVSPDDIGAGGHMAITSSVTFAVAYRKDLLGGKKAPEKWSDYLDSKYRGKMTASPILFARMCAALGAFQGADEWLGFARRFRKESGTLWSNDLMEQVITSGERQYAVAVPSYIADLWKMRGREVAVVIPEPVFITQFGTVVMREAPHPNAARLLAAWLAGVEGRVAREKALLAVDLRPTSRHPQAVALRSSGKTLLVDNTDAMAARNILIPKMDRIISGLE